MGGMLSLMAARARPDLVRGVVLLDALVGGATALDAALEAEIPDPLGKAGLVGAHLVAVADEILGRQAPVGGAGVEAELLELQDGCVGLPGQCGLHAVISWWFHRPSA